VKIRVDVDITPQELRDFFGLPNIQPMQDELIAKIRENMQRGIEGFDPATLMRPFLPEHLRSLEALQKSFWDSWSQSVQQGGRSKKPPPDKGS
jgi:hypothetical protein